ncbi:MAG: type II toxin-antitoxin system VapC family toxin [Bacteroidales bacterium]
MSGNSLLVDTNILIYLLKGNERVYELLNERDLWVSFITEMELLSFDGHTKGEIQTIKSFLNNCKIIDINRSIKDTAINIRKINKLKLPDAINTATAHYLNIPLITADKGFKNIDDIISVIVDF